MRVLVSRLLLGALLCSSPVNAQSITSVSGVVKDISGGVLVHAIVEAVVAGRTVASATTGPDGRYAFDVAVGVPFEIRAQREGFADYVSSLAGTMRSVARDIVMQIGGVSDTLVVTASRGAESRANVTQSVTVATRAEIAALGSTSLADVMRFVPGVNIEAIGREGATAALFSRGGESDYNLVLIDGVRVNASGGQFDFSRLAAAEIERVEVVRGAQSALWGSDAMGSVVQVFTRRAGAGAATTPELAGSFEGGSFNTRRGDVRINGGARGRLDYQAGVTYRGTDGAFVSRLPEADRFEQQAFDAAVGATFGHRLSLRSGLRYSDGNGRNVGPISFGSRDTGGEYSTKDLSGHLAAAHTVGTRFAGTASLNYFRYSSVSADTVGDAAFGTYAVLEGTPNAIFPNGTRLVRLLGQTEFNALVAAGATPGVGQFLASRQSSDFPFSSLTKFRRPAFRYQGDYQWSGGQRLSAGYEWERESNPVPGGLSLSNNSAFVQQQFSLHDRWFVTLGGRIDSKESYASFFSPKLSAGGFLVPLRQGTLSSVRAFGNIGKGIKSPTFAERFGGSFADASPDLRVERARTADVGIEATLANQRVRALVTYFNNDYVDQVAYRFGPVGDGVPEYINIDGSEAHGMEFEVALQRALAGFSAAATYALVDTAVVTNLSTSQQFQPGQPLLRRPKHSGTIRAAYVRGRATVDANLRLVGQRHDNSFLSLRTVPNAARPAAITTDITVNPGYAVVGLGLDVRAHRLVTLFLRGDNIADTAYDSALGYPGLPRAIVAGARFALGAGR